MKLANKVAIVTGAGRNIGEEIAALFALEGAAVAVVDLDQARADKVVARLTAEGGVARGYICDVADEADVQTLMDAVVTDFGGVDILVNNVAISDNKSILELEKAEWDRVMAVTLTAPFLTSKAAARAMIAGDRAGRIVNVTSTSGYFGRARALAYTSAKGGLVNFTRSLAIQLAPYNIRVNSVVPNKIGSPVGRDTFNPDRKVVNLRNRPGEPIDLARAVLFLVSDESDFIAGTEIFVDGGCSVMMAGE